MSTIALTIEDNKGLASPLDLFSECIGNVHRVQASKRSVMRVETVLIPYDLSSPCILIQSANEVSFERPNLVRLERSIDVTSKFSRIRLLETETRNMVNQFGDTN